MSALFSMGFTTDAADTLARRLQVLSSPARLTMLSLLNQRGEMRLVEFEAYLTLKQPTITHHMKVLRAAGLVIRRKQDKTAFYRADLRAVADIASALSPWQAS